MIVRIIFFSFLILEYGRSVNAQLNSQDYLREQFQAKLQDVLPVSVEESKGDVHNQVENLVEFLVEQVQANGLENLLNPKHNITSLIDIINNLCGGEILFLKDKHIRINQANLSDQLKLKGGIILSNHVKSKLILHITQKILNETVDDYLAKFQKMIKSAKFSIQVAKIEPNSATQQSTNNISRTVIAELIHIFLRPVQSQLNITLVNLTNDLLKFYVNDPPKELIPSIITFAINEIIRNAVQIIEALRKTINASATTNRLTRASASPQSNVIVSLITFILSPIRFILAILLSPIRKFLMNFVDSTFVNLRPIVGKLVLLPLETLLKTLIGLIPCLKCE